jgi:hypothetical protein
MNKQSEKKLKSKINKLQSEVGHSYDSDHAPTLLEKWKLLKAHKIWVTESRRKENESAYLRAMNIHEATVGLLTPVCELLNAQGTSGMGAFAVTKNKMEWSIIIHQMGVRNPKTGRIDKRLSPAKA